MSNRETNEEFVQRLMTTGCPTGAMIQPYVLEALRIYSEQVVAAPPGHFENGLMTDQVWRGTAQHVLKQLEKRDVR